MKNRHLAAIFLPFFWHSDLLAEPIVRSLAEATPNQSSCNYVVKKGDNLSRILVKLGMLPIYGKRGVLRSVIEENKERVRKDGDLIFPQARISIPRHLVRQDEMCVEGEEKDLSRRIALYSEAEAEIHTGKYSGLCKEVRELAKKHTRPENQGRLIHLAAVCEYQEGNLRGAHQLWQMVLNLQPDPSLVYRATYNMALVECQTDQAAVGYDKLRNISPELWQTQATFERRTYLDLAVYCAEAGVGPQAKFDLLSSVAQTSSSPELKTYAEEKLNAEFSNSKQCDVTATMLDGLKDDPNIRRWRATWRESCHRYGRTSLFTLSINPTHLTYRGPTSAPSWVGLGATFDSRFQLGNWVIGVGADGFLQPISKSQTASDVRLLQFGAQGGYVVELSPDWQLEATVGAGYMTFLTSDKLLGFYDLILYRLHLGLFQMEADSSWFRIGADFSITNSDLKVFDTGNGIVALTIDSSPSWTSPVFVGVRGEYGSLTLGGPTYRMLSTQARIGVSW